MLRASNRRCHCIYQHIYRIPARPLHRALQRYQQASANQPASQPLPLSPKLQREDEARTAAAMPNTILVDVPPAQSPAQLSPALSPVTDAVTGPVTPTTAGRPIKADATTDTASAASGGKLRIPAKDVDPFLVIKKDPNEVKDSELIFKTVWQNLLAKYNGEENLTFPKDIMWLAGAPGAGKNAMTPLIMDYRGITAKPIEVSSLLTSPEAMKLKSSGQLVSNQQVIELLFERLLKPEYQTGALVDGFPRTKEQSECIKLLYDRMTELRAKFKQIGRPSFHITVLFISKDESVRRQLRRGKLATIHNEIVAATGVGELKPVRETDLDARLAEERYRQFQEQVFDSLKYIKDQFAFHFINADGGPSEVQSRIIRELKYQSSNELADETFEIVRKIPLASEIIQNARHQLIQRLETYRTQHSELFANAINIINSEFTHILKRQALTGCAIIRSSNPVFHQQPMAVDMALDVLTERGFTCVLDVTKEPRPLRVNLQTGDIEMRETRVYEFQISFAKPAIRQTKQGNEAMTIS